MPLPLSVKIPGSTATPIQLKAGKVTLIAGPNGVGKSALLHQLYRAVGQGNATYYPGHRHITFNNGWDNVGQDITQLTTHLFTQTKVFNRHKSAWGEDHFKSVIRQFQNSESAYNQSIVDRLRADGIDVLSEAKERRGPIAIANSVFRAAGLVVSLDTDKLGLRVTRGGSVYRIDQLSDGERAALFIVAAIIVQDPGTVIMIDEPERHLHPSISAPLIQSAVRHRSDIAFLFASHDMSLIESMSDCQIIHVTDSVIQQVEPELRDYTAILLKEEMQIPEEFKVDLLGIRKNVLFIEGDNTSIDREIYTRIYPGWKIIPKGGWEKCVEAVKALTGNSEVHWINAAGLIDSDGKNSNEIAALRGANIFTLPCPTVENLFFLRPLIEGVADAIFSHEGGPTPASRLQSARDALATLLEKDAEDIAGRIAVWQINRQLQDLKVSIKDVRCGLQPIGPIDAPKIYADALLSLKSRISQGDYLEIITKIPIKNTSIPSGICKALGVESFKKYQAIVLRQLDHEGTTGISMQMALRETLPLLR